jgi:hypothetical protein
VEKKQVEKGVERIEDPASGTECAFLRAAGVLFRSRIVTVP